MKKGQSSFEFILIMGIMFFIILGAFAVIQGRLTAITLEHKAEVLNQLGNVLRTELIAADTFDGYYYREFILPSTAQGYLFNTTITGPLEVTLTIDEQQYLVFTSNNLTGDFKQGKNIIKKYPNGTITVNL